MGGGVAGECGRSGRKRREKGVAPKNQLTRNLKRSPVDSRLSVKLPQDQDA